MVLSCLPWVRCSCLLVLIISVYEYMPLIEFVEFFLISFNNKELPEKFQNFKRGIQFQELYMSGKINTTYSSVWCRGSNHTNRMCHFENLCFLPKTGDFIFFHSPNSSISGVPSDRFNPALLDFSAVEDHNTQYFNYVDIPSAAIIHFNVTMIDGTAVIFKRFNPDNLMHVFHDDLLTVYFTLREICSLNILDPLCLQNIYLMYAEEREPGPYSFLYENFLIRKPIYISNLDPRKLYCLKKSYIGLNKHTMWYQYGFKHPQGPLDKNSDLISREIRKFKYYFKSHFNMTKRSDNKKYAILLSRKNNRLILNENEIAIVLKNYTNLDVRIMSLENHSLLDLIELISKCHILVGMHGGLLILSMFLSPGSIFIELFPYAVSPYIYTPYKTLVTLPGMGIIYKAWENKIESNSVTHPENSAQYGGIYHLSVEQQKSIQSSSEVPPHICCYNPAWLYRIYQDTIVDIASFTDLLQTALKNQLNFSLKNHNKLSNEIIHSKIYPGEVKDIICSESYSENYKFNVSWTPPWNLKYLNYKVSEYELWLQLSEAEDIKAYITKQTYFIFKKSSNVTYIWIRCHIDGRAGPFSSNPLVCSL